MQPATSAPPARSQYTSTRKKHSGDRRVAPLPPTAPHPSPQVAARGGVSVGGQSPRLARTPGAQHGRVLPCGHRSTAGPALSTSAARTTICRLPRQGGQAQEETRASRPPGAEGRVGLGQARAGRTAARGEGAPRPVSLTIQRLPAHPNVIVPRRRARPPPPGGSRGPCPYAPAVRDGRDVAAGESRCLLGSAASDSYPRFCRCLGPAPWLPIFEILLPKARGIPSAAGVLRNWVMVSSGTQIISGFYSKYC